MRTEKSIAITGATDDIRELTGLNIVSVTRANPKKSHRGPQYAMLVNDEPVTEYMYADEYRAFLAGAVFAFVTGNKNAVKEGASVASEVGVQG